MTRSTQSRFSWGGHRSRVRPPAKSDDDEIAQARVNLRSAQAHHDTVSGRRRKVTLPRMPWDDEKKEEKQ